MLEAANVLVYENIMRSILFKDFISNLPELFMTRHLDS